MGIRKKLKSIELSEFLKLSEIKNRFLNLSLITFYFFLFLFSLTSYLLLSVYSKACKACQYSVVKFFLLALRKAFKTHHSPFNSIFFLSSLFSLLAYNFYFFIHWCKQKYTIDPDFIGKFSRRDAKIARTRSKNLEQFFKSTPIS